ncbi:TIGR02302 family protein [Rhizobium rhizosphaerae]|uniref:TIGR02302 family protein n=1 Tax=Xaviernesmea rhizosphaerae TaxID=1672749 RepID=A0ABX3PB59_9HYPH|nr:TIGR02302 family protein [Xaviernesmea rhizosphaerae]OQP85229.1 TIGR02302 family protein [Xaviernesmea rhizosphaerae]
MATHRPDRTDMTQPAGRSPLARMLDRKRLFARLVLTLERAAPHLLAPLSILLIFLSVSWFGLFRMLPAALHIALAIGFAVAFIGALVPLARIRLPSAGDADRMLESRNHLPHQAIAVQEDRPATTGAFGQALWAEHQARMARRIHDLETGLPRPDIARFDRHGLRALPVLIACVAFGFSFSNRAGELTDIAHTPQAVSDRPDVRIDAWVTPPAYTGRAPLFLTGREAGPTGEAVTVPQGSELTVRITSASGDVPVTYRTARPAEPQPVPRDTEKAEGEKGVGGPQAPEGSSAGNAGSNSAGRAAATAGVTHQMRLTENGRLDVAGSAWTFTVTPDHAPTIAFEGKPRPTVNAALEIGFTAKDDYGIDTAWAEIKPVDPPAPDARPLYPAPEYRLDLPRRNAKEVKGTASRNLSEHPLAGKRVTITLVARDAAGQEGRSQPETMILPARRFTEPLAAAVAEERQVFALDANALPRALDLNDAVTLRADETIPNLTHYLLIESARGRMMMAQNEEMLRDTAAYIWDIALGIEDGDLSLAEKRLRDAQQNLSDALERGASDEEIAKLMQELREAMKQFMQAMAEQAMKNPQMARPNPQNMLNQQDLDRMMNQIENLARSGSKDQARQLLSEMQRMMNNLQAGRPQPGQQQSGDNSQMRQQMDKLGRLLQDQQKLMEQTFQYDQALRDRMQGGDPMDGDELFDQQPMPGQEMNPQQGQQGQDGQQGQQGQNGGKPTDQMTEEQLRQALKDLKAQQDALRKQLGELQKGLQGMGMQPGKGFGEAGREMQGAAGALGQGRSDQALGGQGRALQALRQGAQEMMQQMQSQQGQGQGPGQGIPQYGQNGRDPLGRRQQNVGPEFGDQVKVPDEIDTQRARQILEEIRRRLGNNLSPEVERRYLERLLDIQ